MFKKFFNFLKDIIFSSVRNNNKNKVIIASIRALITITLAIKFHFENKFNTVEKVVGTLFLGAAWIEK